MGHLPFSVGRKVAGYIKVSREHEPAALLPRKVAGICTVGPKNHFDAMKRNISCLEGTEPRSLGRPARSVLGYPGSYNNRKQGYT
jgi:hypothetical protein